MKLSKGQIWNKAYKIARDLEYKYPGIKPKKIADYVTAISFVESSYNVVATNPHSSAKGLMQVVRAAQDHSEQMLGIPYAANDKLFDPDYNLLIGTNYFLYQYKRYGNNRDKAVIAYNQGHYNSSTDGQIYLNKFKKAYSPSNTTMASFNPYVIGGAVLLSGIAFLTKKYWS